MEHFYEEFGKRVRAARDALGLSQEDLARRVSLSRASIANVERGAQRVLLHQVVELAAALGVAPGQLIPQPDQLGGKVRRAVEDAGYPEDVASWVERAVERVVVEEGGRHDTEDA